jgi:phosphate transport system substrate-binding protein
VALAARDAGPFVQATRETLTNRSYPLTRSIYFYIDKEPGRPLSPKVKDFIKYVLSEEGQDLIRKNGVYFPLPARVVREQLDKID